MHPDSHKNRYDLLIESATRIYTRSQGELAEYLLEDHDDPDLLTDIRDRGRVSAFTARLFDQTLLADLSVPQLEKLGFTWFGDIYTAVIKIGSAGLAYHRPPHNPSGELTLTVGDVTIQLGVSRRGSLRRLLEAFTDELAVPPAADPATPATRPRTGK